jgi:hypothetical protein
MRLTARRALALALGALAVPVAACVLADPPASLPVTPIEAPQIEHELVVPPATDILRAWPPEFIVPVHADTSASVPWRAFLDYDPLSPSTASQNGILDPAEADDAGLRVLRAHIPPPADLGACHTLEVLVALSFDGHAVTGVGGDSATWFYSPSGSLDGCSVYDAGPPDGGDGGDGGGDAGVPVEASADASLDVGAGG